jgi:DNA repair protein RadC
MYRIPKYRVQLVRESTHTAPTRVIASPADAYLVLRDFMEEQDRELFVVLMLDTRHKVTGLNVVSIGSLNASLVHPREAFKPAILANAAALVLAHNHPSGDPEPSADDLALTARLKQAGELLGIAVLDHVVIGEGRYVSLREQGLL